MEERLARVPDRVYFFVILPMLAALPRRLAYSLSSRMAAVLRRSHPESVAAARHSLQQVSLGTPENVDELVCHMFESISCEDLDAYFYPFWTKRNLSGYFQFSGLERLDEALGRGRGAILLTGHLGALCAGMVALGRLGYPIRHVSRDYILDRSMGSAFRRFALIKIRWMESAMGRPLIRAHRRDGQSGAGAVLQIGQALSQNQLVSMALDVNPAWVTDAVEVDFMGKRCRFSSSIARLAREFDCPVIPYFNLRNRAAPWQHQLEIGTEIQSSSSLIPDVQKGVERLEKAIRRDPGQWFVWDSLAHFLSDSEDTGPELKHTA